MTVRTRRRHVPAEERGMALPGVLLLAAFLVGVTGWLVGHVRADLAMATAVEEDVSMGRVASAAIESVAMALGQVSDWTPVGALGLALPCPGVGIPVVSFDEPQERAWLQVETDTGSRWGADTPVWQRLWRCHAPGVLGRWPPRGAAPSVVVWVADDPEGDGQPLGSANQRLLLRAVARGPGQSRGAAAVTIARVAPGAPVTLAAWRGTGAP